MNRLRALLTWAFTCATLASAQEINVENFNNPGATGSVIAGSSWTNNVTRGPETIIVAARDDNGWGAIGQSINATGMNYITIFARLDAGNEAASLVLNFEDQNLRTHTISVPTANFSLGSITSVQVPIGTWPSGFRFANITGWSIGGGTPPPGTLKLRMTFDHLLLSANQTLAAPTITSQPVDRVVGVGGSTTLAVSAAGTPTLRYQWKRNTTAIPGATSATLAFSNVTLSSTDNYQVDVSNDFGTTPSRVATLTVVDVQPTHALATASAGGYIPGGTVTITNTITYAGTTPTALGWQVLLPTGWSYVSDGGSAPQTKPTVGATGLAEWTWTTVPPSPVTFTCTFRVPGASSGPQSITSLAQITQSGVSGGVLARPDPLVVQAAILPHSADVDGNFSLNVGELTRVIQLYNTRIGTTRTGAYTNGTVGVEDGFALDLTRASGTVVTLSRYHSADTDKDARISLVELTRVIELFNHRVGSTRLGQYHVQTGTEDGYAAGP